MDPNETGKANSAVPTPPSVSAATPVLPSATPEPAASQRKLLLTVGLICLVIIVIVALYFLRVRG